MAKEALVCPVRADWGWPLLALLVPVLLLASTAPSAAQETWTATSTVGAPSARSYHTAVWTGSKMIVWGGRDYLEARLNTGGVYDPAGDTWAPTSTTRAPSGRTEHTAIWTGSKMIVWGGDSGGSALNTGGIYDPASDLWTPVSADGAPDGRQTHTAVWTGSRMIVWGGATGTGHTNSGAAYDPATNKWTPTSTVGAPSARSHHTAVWTGRRMIIWGGADSPQGGWLATGAAYDPANNTWTPTSTVGAPSGRGWHTAVWTGTRMIIWGGNSGGTYLNTGGVYYPPNNTWIPTSTLDAPLGRYLHTAIWTGTKMVIWGGFASPYMYFKSGAVYDPNPDAWIPTTTVGAPYARFIHTATWTGSTMIIWGGEAADGLSYFYTDTGGVYSNPAVLPPPPPPADFYTVTPCRVADTRNADGPRGGPALAAGATRSFPVTGICGIPSTAIAVSVNLTVTQPAAQGNLTLYPGDAAGPPLVSNINFTPGVTRANNGVVLLATSGGTINVKNASAGSVHFVLDVNGYFQ